jgi:hypothetical protein
MSSGPGIEVRVSFHATSGQGIFRFTSHARFQAYLPNDDESSSIIVSTKPP